MPAERYGPGGRIASGAGDFGYGNASALYLSSTIFLVSENEGAVSR